MNAYSFRKVTTSVSQSEKELLDEINELKRVLNCKVEQLRSKRLSTLYNEIDRDSLQYGDLIYVCSTHSIYCYFASLGLVRDDFVEVVSNDTISANYFISDSICKDGTEERTDK